MPLQHHRKFPGEVVRIVNTGVATEAAIRRHEVRGVPANKDAPVLKPLRDVGRRAPARAAVDFHVEIRHTHAALARAR